MTWTDIYNYVLDKGLTIDEFHELTFSQFWEIAEIRNRQEIKELRMHRNLLQAFTGEDLRFKMPLPGDFDDIQIGQSQEELEARIDKLKIRHLFDGKS